MTSYWEDRPARGRTSNFPPSKLQLKGVTTFLLFKFTKGSVQWKMVWLPSLPPRASPLPFSWFLNVFTIFSSSQSLYDFIISPSIAHLCPLKSGQSDFLEYLFSWHLDLLYTNKSISVSLPSLHVCITQGFHSSPHYFTVTSLVPLALTLLVSDVPHFKCI